MACLRDDGARWSKCSHLTVEDDGSEVDCAKGIEVAWQGEEVHWPAYRHEDCEHYDPQTLPTSCAYWNSNVRSIYSRKCGRCDACEGEGDQKLMERKESGK